MLLYTEAVAVSDASELSVECDGDGSCDVTSSSADAAVDADVNPSARDVL